jgi:peptide/nickel transport system permease protein
MAQSTALPRTAIKRKRIIWADAKRLPWPSITILTLLLIVLIFGDLLTPYSPYSTDLPNRLLPPAWQTGGNSAHLLGTDTLGRDLVTRIIYGARITLAVAFIAVSISGFIGLTLGILAGYYGGWVDAIVSRMVDSFLALPSILLALVFAVTLGPSMTTVIIAISAVLWSRTTRMIRGETMALKSREFVSAAKVAGRSSVKIMLVHILPNVLNTFMILLTLDVSSIMLIEASLSFLGAGIPPPTPSWGQMVSEGRNYITSAWWISLFPGAALALTVFGFQLFGDWLRDTLDPKLRQL